MRAYVASFILALTLATGGAFGIQENKNFYVGLGAGAAHLSGERNEQAGVGASWSLGTMTFPGKTVQFVDSRKVNTYGPAVSFALGYLSAQGDNGFVWGVEGYGLYTSLKDTHTDGAPSGNRKSILSMSFAVGGVAKIGWQFGDWTPFLKGGIEWLGVTHDYTEHDKKRLVTTKKSTTTRKFAPVFGGGVTYDLSEDFFIGAEYSMALIPNFSHSFDDESKDKITQAFSKGRRQNIMLTAAYRF